MLFNLIETYVFKVVPDNLWDFTESVLTGLFYFFLWWTFTLNFMHN